MKALLALLMIVLLALSGYARAEDAPVDETEDSLELIPTPFGLMPQQCVHAHPSGVEIKEVPTGVEAHHPNGTIVHYPALPVCLRWAEKMRKERLERRALKLADNDTLLGDGWLDNAGYWPPANVGSFTSNYLVPRTPSSRSGQYLYYFIGVENMSTAPLTILQPVMAYSNAGWNFASWNCCPAGQSHRSAAIGGFGPGHTVYGSITATSSTCTISSTAAGRTTTLTVPANRRTFGYADATLETYYVRSCSQMASGPMTYSNMRIRSTSGAALTPRWGVTGRTMCNGRMSASSTQVTITHN